jgi:rhodanese-related sulfurtransferase
MDTVTPSVSPSRVFQALGTAAAPLIVDLRRDEIFAASDILAAGATWRDPFDVAQWGRYMPRHRPVVVYCVHGHEISRNVCSALRTAGVDASYLDGGFEAWRAQKGMTLRKSTAPAVPSTPDSPSAWITRERPKIDRLACPWLIRRFIDPCAQFLFVPAETVLARAAESGATPYDVPGVRFTHRAEKCSFDALVADFGLASPSLDRLASIVRGADTDRLDQAPQSAGLLAISLGLGENFGDDLELLERGMIVYDALYAWCRQAEEGRSERHNWRPAA